LLKPAQAFDAQGAGASPDAARPHRRLRPQLAAIAVGASTGGPQALVQILRTLAGGKLDAALLIAIHTPAEFSQSVAVMMGRVSGREVVVPTSPELVRPDVIYMPSGNMHLRLMKRLGAAYVESCAAPHDVRYRPCIDVLFDSAAYVYGPALMAVVLTGMGADGLEGARVVSASGGCVLAQKLETCVVESMPSAVISAGLAQRGDTPDGIAAHILLRTGSHAHAR